MSVLVIGVDPGARRTGVVVREGSKCWHWKVFECVAEETEIGVGPIYWSQINDHIAEAAQMVADKGHAVVVAVEGVRPPRAYDKGKKALTPPLHLMALGATFGAILGRYCEAVVIPPGGNGSGALVSYPEDLVTTGERRLGLNRQAGSSSLVSHARSAWDVAGLAVRR